MQPDDTNGKFDKMKYVENFVETVGRERESSVAAQRFGDNMWVSLG